MIVTPSTNKIISEKFDAFTWFMTLAFWFRDIWFNKISESVLISFHNSYHPLEVLANGKSVILYFFFLSWELDQTWKIPLIFVSMYILILLLHILHNAFLVISYRYHMRYLVWKLISLFFYIFDVQKTKHEVYFDFSI